MNLANWADTIFGVVEQDGATVARVRLMTAATGDVWHTWHPPFPSPEAWEQSAESILRGLEQHTSGRVQVTFVAETRSGETISQLPWRMNGKLVAGSLEGSAQASAAVLGSVGQTMERLTELVNRQLEQARRTSEIEMETKFQMMELIRAYRHRDIMGETNEVPSLAMQMLQEWSPELKAAAEVALTLVQQRLAQAATKPAVVVQPPVSPPPPTPPAASSRRAKKSVIVES
jgi:hypothetical protein